VIVRVFQSEMGIPMIRLKGEVTEKDGAELASKVMEAILTATMGNPDYPCVMSERAPCTRAPDTGA